MKVENRGQEKAVSQLILGGKRQRTRYKTGKSKTTHFRN